MSVRKAYKIYDPITGLYKDRGTKISWSKKGFVWNGIPQLKIHLRQMQARSDRGRDRMIIGPSYFRFDPRWEVHTIEIIEDVSSVSSINDFLVEHK